MNAPAARFPLRFDAAPFAAELDYAQSAVHAVRRAWPEMEGWVNFPLYNQSGAADDLRLELYDGAPTATAHAASMPATTKVVEAVIAKGFAVQQARIAVLGPRELLRCHVDMYPAARLIMPLNRQGDAFRHVFGAECVAMQPGEVWGVDGDTCHGAANVAATGQRIALLIDARLDRSDLPPWFAGGWTLPTECSVERPAWTAAEREKRVNDTAELPFRDAEREWLFLPFEYALTPEEGYAELIGWCEREARLERAAYWRKHACVCVPE